MSERPNIALMTESQKDTLVMALWQELEQLKQENAQYKARLLEAPRDVQAEREPRRRRWWRR